MKKLRKQWHYIEPRFTNYTEGLSPFIIDRIGSQMVSQLQALDSSS
ncbi:hypothetical protein [Parendozoicomonas sp. Alg238-R29]|nr:hypothetical protein [Parendozoicomonas sp. Alg238-R29]